jgi:lysozyme
MKVSREGMVLIKSFEGFRPRAVRREDGGWVIGYGHTLSAREGLSVGEADAELLLQYDLLPIVKLLHDQAPAGLNQHQFDALASFAFSVGAEPFTGSDVLQRLNAGSADEAADAMVGWPEATPPDARLRRRAAERALFVADPGSPVALADLLAAPLPPPAVVEPTAPQVEIAEPVEATAPASEPETAVSARAAAVATLLGEAAVAPTAEPPAPDPEAEAEPDPAPAEVAVETPLQSPVVIAFPGGAEAPPSDMEPEPQTDATVSEDRAEAEIEAQAEPARLEQSEPDFAPTVQLIPPTQLQRYSPYGAAIIGPLPDLQPVAAATPAPSAAEAPPPVVTIHTEPQPVEGPLLVLSPLAEDDIVPAARPVWGEIERADPAPSEDQTVMFEDETGLHETLGPVMRHPAEIDSRRRFDWSEAGAFLTMGGIGLVSFGAAMAAFRRAAEEGPGAGETATIGWVLALIAALCVGASGFNLYQRLGRSGRD